MASAGGRGGRAGPRHRRRHRSRQPRPRRRRRARRRPRYRSRAAGGLATPRQRIAGRDGHRRRARLHAGSPVRAGARADADAPAARRAQRARGVLAPRAGSPRARRRWWPPRWPTRWTASTPSTTSRRRPTHARSPACGTPASSSRSSTTADARRSTVGATSPGRRSAANRPRRRAARPGHGRGSGGGGRRTRLRDRALSLNPRDRGVPRLDGGRPPRAALTGLRCASPARPRRR